MLDGTRGDAVVQAFLHVAVEQPVDHARGKAISRAEAVDVSAPAQRVRIEATVDPGGVSGATEVDVVATPHVAIDFVGGSLRFKVSAEPFAYM